jgi:hypothetical protein
LITEQQYKEAIEIIHQYTRQINAQTAKALQQRFIEKRVSEIHPYDWRKYFPTISTRLINALIDNFQGTRICDISKSDFIRARNCGLKSWDELCEIKSKFDEQI